MWDKKQIESHVRASEKLVQIKDSVIKLFKSKQKINEKEASDFILSEFNRWGLETDDDIPIVAFGRNTDRPHYFPKEISRDLKEGDVIIIDLWAKEKNKDSPFADITWMALKSGKVSKEVKDIFDIVINSRDTCINFLKEELKKGKIPTGKELDDITRNFISAAGYGKDFLHSTSHSLGTISVHGTDNNLNQKDNSILFKNLGYTIEPGIYLKDNFGIRSEIDFYISDDLKLILTTPLQKELDLI
jgi:Xaa-Pro aminopeptidase